MDVAVWGHIGEFVSTFTWCGPAHLELVKLGGGADPENFPEIVRGEIAAAIVLRALAAFAACFPKYTLPDSIAIARHAFQPETQPIVPFGRVVLQEHGRAAVGCNEHIERSVIVIVAHSQSSRSEALLKRRSPLRAYIF